MMRAVCTRQGYLIFFNKDGIRLTSECSDIRHD